MELTLREKQLTQRSKQMKTLTATILVSLFYLAHLVSNELVNFVAIHLPF